MQKRTWKLIGQTCAVALLISACSRVEKSEHQIIPSDHTPIPGEVTAAIEKEFPGAMPYRIAIDTLLQHLLRAGIVPDQILWGQSTCVDDITNTKDKYVHPEIKDLLHSAD